eukprot:11190379-Lingulodinium_polyedra.AAC.1
MGCRSALRASATGPCQIRSGPIRPVTSTGSSAVVSVWAARKPALSGTSSRSQARLVVASFACSPAPR